MGKKIEVNNYSNMQVTRKIRPYNPNKERMGIDWWTESQGLKTFDEFNKDERRINSWRRIIKETDIRNIYVHINGSGDDGGIEEIRFTDEDDVDILPKYETRLFNLMPKFHNDYLDVSKEPIDWNVSYDDSSPNTYQSNLVKFATSMAGATANREYFNNMIDNGWMIWSSDRALHRLNNTYTRCIMYRLSEDEKFWDINVDDMLYDIHFPELSRGTYCLNTSENILSELIESLYYGILPGGWEINEGSNNTIEITNEFEDGKDWPVISVASEYYEPQEQSYVVKPRKVQTFINDMLSKENVITYNLDTKKGSDGFYDMIQNVRAARNGD